MCIECDLSFAHKVFLCVPCHKVWKYEPYGRGGSLHCPTCGAPGRNMGFRWRAPRLSNKTAWKRIEKGEYLWEKSKIPDGGKLNRAKTKAASVIPQNWRRKFLK